MEKERETLKAFIDKNVLITGGNGFIGANLTEKLLKIGANVTIFTNRIEDEWQKKNKIQGEVKVIIGDITEKAAISKAIKGQDYVFHLAGLSGAVESNSRPLLDLEVNCKGSLNLLEGCKENGKINGILFTSSQLVYGQVEKSPVVEDARTEPTSIYGINKLAIEKYFVLYHNLFGLNTTVLRISNPFGPRQSMEHTYGIVNYFIGLALKNESINIYGKGLQKRDYIYIEDLVDAMLLAILNSTSYGKIYNVGGPVEKSLSEMAQTVISTAGSGSIKHVEWPEEAKKAEIGDIFLSKERLFADTGWKPKTTLREGVKRTILYYKIPIKTL